MKLMVYRVENFERSHSHIGMDTVIEEKGKRKRIKKHLKNNFNLDLYISSDNISFTDRLLNDIDIIPFDNNNKNYLIVFSFSHDGIPVNISSTLSTTYDLKEKEYIEYILKDDLSEEMKRKMGFPKVISLFGKGPEELEVVILKANIHDKGPEIDFFGELFQGLKEVVKSFKRKRK